MQRSWIVLGSLAGLAAVGMAAIAAHAPLAPGAGPMLDRAVQMQGWHALALVLCGVWDAGRGRRLADLAGFAFAAGLLGFCGGVYALALGGVRLPGIAPVGGTLLMVGWALLALAALRRGAGPGMGMIR